jgi:hypothetical protein
MPSRFAIKSSRRFVLLLSFAHLIVLPAIWSTDLLAWGRLGLSLLVLLGLSYRLSRHLSPSSKHSWSNFSLDKQHITVITCDGAELAGEISPQTMVTPYFVLLRVKLEGHRMPAFRVIFPDGLQGDAYREFCVRLRYAQ